MLFGSLIRSRTCKYYRSKLDWPIFLIVGTDCKLRRCNREVHVAICFHLSPPLRTRSLQKPLAGHQASTLARMAATKPITFCEHLQLSSIGVQPASISFHVPDQYHKRIIGIGGQHIQRIMKKYGVYVKFSNAEEFANLGGYNDNDDNVVARTPAKNASNLENLKLSVMELVAPKVSCS